DAGAQIRQFLGAPDSEHVVARHRLGRPPPGGGVGGLSPTASAATNNGDSQIIMRMLLLPVVALTMVATSAYGSTSAFESAPPDPGAVTVKAKADGKADDSEAIQQAIDKSTENSPGGVVYLPSGRYRITRSILVWPGVRVYGVGRTRPVLVLANNTAGFDKG